MIAAQAWAGVASSVPASPLGAGAFSTRFAGRRAHDAIVSSRNANGSSAGPKPSPTAITDTTAAVTSKKMPA